MAFSSDSGGGKPMAEINVTPLVDVMLVLLIIFMITAPLMTHKVKVELPEANLLHRDEDKGPHVTPITIAVEESGALVGIVSLADVARLAQVAASHSQEARVWVPSPKMVRSSPRSACPINAGKTRPSFRRIRGP